MGTELADSNYFVLHPDTSASAVVDLAARQGWELTADEPCGHDKASVRRWRVTGSDSDVELMVNHVGGHRTIVAPDAIRDRIVECLPLWNVDDLFEQARSAVDPLVRMRALRALQFFQIAAAMHAAPRSPLDPEKPHLRLIADDERYLAAFRRGLEDPVRGVQRAALAGLCLSFYPGAQAILREYRDRLPDHIETIDWYLEKGTYRIQAKPEDS